MTTAVDRQTQAGRRATAESALLDAAALLAATKGIDNTSLAAIGEAAGYSRGIVNHHFGTKSALVERLAERTQQEVLSNLPVDITDPTSLSAICTAYLDIVGQNDRWSRAFITLWGAATPETAPLRQVFLVRDEWFREKIAAIVRVGQQTNVISAEVGPAGVGVVIVGMLRGIAAQSFVNPDIDLEQAKIACDAMVRSLIQLPNESRSGAAS